jgi:hypothetical protein
MDAASIARSTISTAVSPQLSTYAGTPPRDAYAASASPHHTDVLSRDGGVQPGMINSSNIEASHAALILHHDTAHNKERLDGLHHQLVVKEAESRGARKAAKAHLAQMEADIAALKEEVQLLEADRTEVILPRSKYDALLTETSHIQKVTAQQVVELKLLEEIVEVHARAERLGLMDLVKSLDAAWGTDVQHTLSSASVHQSSNFSKNVVL